MDTFEDTPAGRFRIQWGLDFATAEREIGRRYGSLKQFKGEPGSMEFRCPNYGETKRLDVYRHAKDAGLVLLLGEITNGVWACGLPTDGIEP